MYKIDLKRKKNGVYMGVSFADGHGETDSGYLADRFRAKGYEVEETDVPDGGGDDSQEKALNRMNTAELEAKATDLGVDLAEATTNKQRVELIQAHIDAAKAPEGTDKVPEGGGEQ